MNSINPQTNSEKQWLLVIDDEENMRHMLKILLEKAGYIVETAVDGFDGLQKMSDRKFSCVLCDLRMPRMDGMEFLGRVKEQLSENTVIMMSAFATIDKAVEAMKMGAYDFISKPFKSDEVLLCLKKAEERERLKRENVWLKTRLKNIEVQYDFGEMIAKSKNMQAVFTLCKKVAQYNTTVLISGESGTGKELIARGVHFNSSRKLASLVPVNCGGIPENLLESELFGYRKGAFTGADKDKKGLFEEADGGTIFLDEIGELPLSLQVKLLRVLQENEIRPIGDSKATKIDVRVIAATARDLQEEVAKGAFREDLFYRLNVMPIRLPSLRERTEDIPLLCRHFIESFNTKFGKSIIGISPSAMVLLLNHPWRGNVRELENMIERAAVLAEGEMLLPENFPIDLGVKPESTQKSDGFEGFSLKNAQKQLEKRLIVKALKETGGNRTQASKLLEISHPSLLSKIKTYHIDF